MDTPQKPPETALQPLQGDQTANEEPQAFRPWTAAQKAEMAIKLYGHPPGWTSLPGDEWVHVTGPYVLNLSAFRRFYEQF